MGSDAAWEAKDDQQSVVQKWGRQSVKQKWVFIGRPLGVPTPNETKTLALVDVF